MGMSAPEPGDDRRPIAATSTPGDEPAEQTRKIETRGLNLYYSAVHAVRDVDFWATSGDITAIIGPSGCGKSTLLRSLNRINDVIPGFRMEGSILLDGEDLTGPGVDIINLRRRMGMLFQRPNPFPASIYDNVAYGLRLAGRVPRSVSDGIVESSLKRVALWDEVSDRLGSSGLGLSGGQQQRLCLARALAVEPEVILMDEPCSALDPIATLRIEELLHELRGSVTMVIVTHNMQQATRVSDRTAFMLVGEGRTGELVEMAPTVELFSNPRDRRTEDYITGRFG
jgi:phosphate transport system ATP-binding protein